MNPADLIREYYDPAGKAYGLLMRHGHQVARKALAVAARVEVPATDLAFIESAAVLHDIGIFLTYAPLLGCTGTRPYLCHGVLADVPFCGPLPTRGNLLKGFNLSCMKAAFS